VNDQSPNLQPVVDNTASLGKRFGAFLLDCVFMAIAMMFLVQYLGLTDIDSQAAKDPEAVQAAILAKMTALTSGQQALMAFFPFIAFFVLHGYLLSRTGQTLGKRILGIAIVTMDNRVPPFFMLITQRYLTQWVAGMVPVIGLFLRLVDILAIYRPDRRCIHDHLAKTKVIDLSIPVQPTPANPNSIIV
jgi:uncharacterized RDD family membrane protein YckC